MVRSNFSQYIYALHNIIITLIKKVFIFQSTIIKVLSKKYASLGDTNIK